MADYIWNSIIGAFLLDEKFSIVKRSDYDSLRSEYPNAIEDPDEKSIKKIISALDDSKFHEELYDANIKQTKKDISGSVGDSNHIVQAVSAIDDIDKSANTLAKRLREWYELHNPEFSHSISDHEKFAELVSKKTRKELLSEIGLKEEESMGAEFDEYSLSSLIKFSKGIQELYSMRKDLEIYVESIMKRSAPNLLALAGPMIGARLIAQAGSIERMSEFPASTIQLLGAEKALFRHMKTGARCPKYGIIFLHPLISSVKSSLQGKVARALADKISIAVKVDFFKGEFVGDNLVKELEKRVAGIRR